MTVHYRNGLISGTVAECDGKSVFLSDEGDQVVALCLNETRLRTVLLIGDGMGSLAGKFSLSGLDVTVATDISSTVLSAVAFDAANPPMPDRRVLSYLDQGYDLVFLGLALHESKDRIDALREARRIARRRVAILEWPYREDVHGAPVHLRLSPIKIQEFVRGSGFLGWDHYHLANFELYRLYL